jgi:nucleotide-binding universal stress UspA family protein
MQTILVPLDGSGVAEQVLPYARLLACTLAARIHLLLVVTDEQKQQLIARYAATSPGEDGRYATDWDWDRRARSELTYAAEGYLIEQVRLLRTAGLHVTYEVASGTPAECIVDTAANEPEALIAMTTHGYTGLRRWSLGSVADTVVHASTRPIFVVRAAEQPAGAWSLQRILVPIDGSALAEQALPLAIELAGRAHAELLLLEAVLPLMEFAPGLSPLTRPLSRSIQLPDTLREQARQQLTATIDRFARPEVAMRPVAEQGYPAEVIVDEASRQRADLIVMATQGYSGLRRLALGSVASRVLHASTIPLMLVRGDSSASTS